MKRIALLPAIVLTAMLAAPPLSGVEFMHRDNQGYDQYSCGTERRGGRVRVKALGGTRYRVISKQLSGEFEITPQTVESNWCLGSVGLARIACGFCRFADPAENPENRSDR
jgi:hypothetical protein